MAEIAGTQREIRGWSKKRELLTDGSRYEFVPVTEPPFDPAMRKLHSIHSLQWEEGGTWKVNGQNLQACNRSAALHEFLTQRAGLMPLTGCRPPADLTFGANEYIPMNCRAGGIHPQTVCAVAWFDGLRDPVLLRTFKELADINQSQTRPAEPVQPPEINETILWHVQQKIQDNLDSQSRSAPVASQVFTAFCRDRLSGIEMHRRNKNWSERTIKLRLQALRAFLKKEFSGLTLEAFFVDRAIFMAAEKQLKHHKTKNISPFSVADLYDANGGD